VFAQRHLDVLRHGQRAEQRAILEQDPPALFQRNRIGFAQMRHIVAQHVDAARVGPLEPDYGAQQHRFAAARAADDAQHLAAPDIEIEAVVDRLRAEPRHQPAHPDDDIVGARRHRHIFSSENRIENAASATMTKKIPSTTD
jgi:hypothetical protein